MSDLGPVLERVRDRFVLPPGAFDRLVARRGRKRRNQRAAAGAVALILSGGVLAGLWTAARLTPKPAASSQPPGQMGSPPPSATPCETLIPDCHAERLPNLVLSDSVPAPDGAQALGPVVGPTDGVIGFDQALILGWGTDPLARHPQAETVQIVLGSVDSDFAKQWQTSHTLFYGVIWGGVTICPAGGNPRASSPPPCAIGTDGEILDALTGDFIVGGPGG
jgi:hypothetical protein